MEGGTRARLISNSDTLTNLTLDVVQEETDIPANVFIDPASHTFVLPDMGGCEV